MAITISGLRISPYTQKDLIPKLVFGDQWGITIKLPTPHQAGDKYALGIDYENTLYPPNRPLCAGTEAFTIDGDELTFNVKLGTARLRDWVSSIRKPMPIAIQIVRIRNNKAETILLDTLLALPSVFDGVVTVCEGDAIQILLDAKLDKPAVEGVAGQILGIDENGQTVWVDQQEIPEQVQSDWEQSDSESPAYIKNKPNLARVATSGSYNDLTDKPTIPEQVQANWNESDSASPAYIENKPQLANVATTGNYNDLNNKPDLSIYVEKVEGKGLSTNDFTDAEKNKLNGIANGAEVNVNADWDESDSTNDAFIKNKPTIPQPIPQVQSDWDESDSTSPAYILNKPEITSSAQADWDESDSTSPSYIENKPEIPFDANDYLCFTLTRNPEDKGVYIYFEIHGSLNLDIEFSKDKFNWAKYTWSNGVGLNIELSRVGEQVWFRGNNNSFTTDDDNYVIFNAKNVAIGFGGGKGEISGNIMSLLDKTCSLTTIPNNKCFQMLFKDSYCNFSELKLPATTLTSSCYKQMFMNCSQMVAAPKLPATALMPDCYYQMFSGCTKLLRIPELPSMTLATACYAQMFSGCTSIVKAELPATTMASYSYQYMFNGCTSLKFVKVAFTTWENTANWLNNVAANGVFECPSALDVTPRGSNRVPTGWTIVRTDAPNPDWDESDSTEASFIKNKPEIGASAQSNWDESDSTDPSYIENKPDIGQMIEDALASQNEPDYLCIDAGNNASQAVVMVTSSGSVPNSISLEYSYDKQNWTAVTLNQWIWFSAQNPKVWLRGNNTTINTQEGIANRNNAHYIIFSNYQNINIPLKVTGNIMSLLDKTCQRDDVPDYCFAQLFNVGTDDPVFALTADSNISLPAKSVGRNGYERLFYKQPLMVKCPEIKATLFGAYACVSMCYSCASLEVAPSVINIQDIQAHAFEYMFGSCTKLVAAPCISFAEKATAAQHWGDYMFKDDTNLSWIKVDNGILYNGNNVSGYYVGSDYTYNWLENTVNGGSAIGLVFAYVGTSISERSNFVASLFDNWDKELAIAEAKSPTSDEQLVFKTICPNANETLVLTPSPNNLIRIAVMPIPKSQIAYASVVIDYASGFPLQYNSDLLTLVDPLVEGKRNHCVVRWSNGVAKLFVVDVEDIPSN